MMQGFELEFEPNVVICHEGDPSSDLYYLVSGKLLICTVSGNQVKVLSRILPGEFVGELSFFDNKPRASSVVTLGPCKLIQIPRHEVANLLPNWFTRVGQNLTKKIRLLDHVVQEAKIRRSSTDESKPLTVDEQRELLAVLTKRDT